MLSDCINKNCSSCPVHFLKVAGAGSVSDDFFFLHNIPGYTELNHPTLMSSFANCHISPIHVFPESKYLHSVSINVVYRAFDTTGNADAYVTW